MTFDRSKYKAAKIEANKAAQQEVEDKVRTKRAYGDYHTIDEGTNYFRIMPPHNPEDPSWQPKVVYWLPVLVEELDSDNKGTGKFERKDRPIFDSRVHGGTEKDLTNEYIRFVRDKYFSEIQDKKERDKILAPVNGYRAKDNKWVNGILSSQSYVCYATKNSIEPDALGQLELYRGDRDRMEELNIDEGSSEPIMTDSFSDPDEGVELIIIKQRGKDNKIEKILKKREPVTKGLKGQDLIKSIESFRDSQRVPDAVLERLSELPSLKSMFIGSYKKSDFERALEALEYFDEKHGYGVFQIEEFLDTVEEIQAYYEDEPSGDGDLPFGDSTKTTQTGSESEDDEEPELDLHSLNRKELKEFIRGNNLKITVIAAMTEDQIILAIENALTGGTVSETKKQDPEPEVANGDLPFDADDSLEETTETPEPEQRSQVIDRNALRERLAKRNQQK